MISCIKIKFKKVFQTPALSVSILKMKVAGHQMSVFKSVLTLFIAQEDHSAMNLFIYYVSLMTIPMN
jgi:hypothetical protein